MGEGWGIVIACRNIEAHFPPDHIAHTLNLTVVICMWCYTPALSHHADVFAVNLYHQFR